LYRDERRRFFHAFKLAGTKPKKERESVKEKKREKKATAPSAKEKKLEFTLFPPPTVEIRFQSPKLLGRGKERVLSKMYSSVVMFKLCPILAVLF
jgi:hypothetical protein